MTLEQIQIQMRLNMHIQNTSLRQLAKKAGIPHTSVTRFMNSEGGVTVDTLLKMVNALNMDIKIIPSKELTEFFKVYDGNRKTN